MSGFDISTTTFPIVRLKKPGGLCERKVADGFEVLEISKGSRTEAIFVKGEPASNVLTTKLSSLNEAGEEENLENLGNEDEMMLEEDKNTDNKDDEDLNEDKLAEESYRTTSDTNSEDSKIQADEARKDVDF